GEPAEQAFAEVGAPVPLHRRADPRVEAREQGVADAGLRHRFAHLINPRPSQTRAARHLGAYWKRPVRTAATASAPLHGPAVTAVAQASGWLAYAYCGPEPAGRRSS